jgi:hypothetical protein
MPTFLYARYRGSSRWCQGRRGTTIERVEQKQIRRRGATAGATRAAATTSEAEAGGLLNRPTHGRHRARQPETDAVRFPASTQNCQMADSPISSSICPDSPVAPRPGPPSASRGSARTGSPCPAGFERRSDSSGSPAFGHQLAFACLFFPSPALCTLLYAPRSLIRTRPCTSRRPVRVPDNQHRRRHSAGTRCLRAAHSANRKRSSTSHPLPYTTPGNASCAQIWAECEQRTLRMPPSRLRSQDAPWSTSRAVPVCCTRSKRALTESPDSAWTSAVVHPRRCVLLFCSGVRPAVIRLRHAEICAVPVVFVPVPSTTSPPMRRLTLRDRPDSLGSISALYHPRWSSGGKVRPYSLSLVRSSLHLPPVADLGP